jgi:hypothetical protein
LCDQQFSKPKFFDFGISVDIVRSMGMWSEVGFGCGLRDVRESQGMLKVYTATQNLYRDLLKTASEAGRILNRLG